MWKVIIYFMDGTKLTEEMTDREFVDYMNSMVYVKDDSHPDSIIRIDARKI